MSIPPLQSPAGFKSCISCQNEVLMKRVKVIEDHARMAPAHLNFATLSVGNMFETLRSTGKLTGVRYVLVLDVEL